LSTANLLRQVALGNSFHSTEEWLWTDFPLWRRLFESSTLVRSRRRLASFGSANPQYPNRWLSSRAGSAPACLRSSRGLATTEAGQNFYERAKRAIEEADEAELVARGAGAGLVGRLRFSAAVTFARLHVIPSLPVFLSCHPGLTIEAVLDDRNINPVEEAM